MIILSHYSEGSLIIKLILFQSKKQYIISKRNGIFILPGGWGEMNIVEITSFF